MNLVGVEDKVGVFRSGNMQRVSLSPSVSLERRRPVSIIKKRSAVQKKAMTDKLSNWQSKT